MQIGFLMKFCPPQDGMLSEASDKALNKIVTDFFASYTSK